MTAQSLAESPNASAGLRFAATPNGGPPSLRTRFKAWWEGYDLSPPKKSLPERRNGRFLHAPSRLPPPRQGQGQGQGQENPESAEFSASNPYLPGMLSQNGAPLWTTPRVRVVEQLWGVDFVSPGGEDYIPYLIRPLGLTPAMSVLDLAAGLGGTPRLMAQKYGAWVTGLERSPLLASEAMTRSSKAGLAKQAAISHYDPENFHTHRRYDSVFAKELFYTITNKHQLLDTLVESLKSRGQLLFTDYILDTHSGSPADILAWSRTEPLAATPWTLEQWAQELHQRNLDLRISEDITAMHQKQVLHAMRILLTVLQESTLSEEVQAAYAEEVALWAQRIKALRAGLRCYRFYALKP